MNFDTSNTGDNWDNYVPQPVEPTPAPPGGPAQVAPLTASGPLASSQMQVDSGGNGGNGGGTGAAIGLGVLRRFIFLPIMGVIALFGWITTQGTTEATDLQAGDCFVMPEAGAEFERLDTEDCTLPHDGQIVESITVPSNASYPSDFDAYWDTVYARCETAATNNVTRFESLPDNTQLLFFSPTEESWEAGDRGSLCYISSVDGLEGSFVIPSES